MKTKAVRPKVLRKFALGQLKPSPPPRQDGAFFCVNKNHILPHVLN